MKTFKAKILKNIKIEWLQDAKIAPMIQGMALNKLRSIYKGTKRFGYMILNGKENILENGCYYLLELKTKTEEREKPTLSLIAFKENGDNIQGTAIFENSIDLN